MNERVWKTQNAYFATTNPGIYMGDQDNMLLFFGIWQGAWAEGHYFNAFDAIRYVFGTYYIHHLFSDRINTGEMNHLFPFELLDRDGSISIRELDAWCRKAEPGCMSIEDFSNAGIYITQKQRKWAEKDIRYWKPEDRIRLLKPLVYSEYRFWESMSGDQCFESGKKKYRLHLSGPQFKADAAKGIIPEILYRDRFNRQDPV